ncbi:hypothetical protein QYE76_000027 [Lolium multiflorum]|uniref:Uncharacterized protein n=1 Tax=Lolium multiflorum TaxID=4521 RepID=A0AAD8PII6_LOLMU|nr:hypothetical protein QYE76_000027 [Lolium multiflorum]
MVSWLASGRAAFPGHKDSLCPGGHPSKSLPKGVSKTVHPAVGLEGEKDPLRDGRFRASLQVSGLLLPCGGVVDPNSVESGRWASSFLGSGSRRERRGAIWDVHQIERLTSSGEVLTLPATRGVARGYLGLRRGSARWAFGVEDDTRDRVAGGAMWSLSRVLVEPSWRQTSMKFSATASLTGGEGVEWLPRGRGEAAGWVIVQDDFLIGGRGCRSHGRGGQQRASTVSEQAS